MATIYIDPSAATNGSGTFASPRNAYPTTVAYGDFVLLKEGTTMNGGWTVPAPTGVGSDTNRLVIGTYDKVTGARLVDKTRAATIMATTAQTGVLMNGVSYVTVQGLIVDGARDFPHAGVRVINASYITTDSCVINMTRPLFGGAYGIRYSNDTGAGTSQTKWVVTNCTVNKTGGNSGIYMVWGANAGEYVTDITITDNEVFGNGAYFGGANATGIALVPRGSSLYLNRAGLCAKGVRIQRNKVRSTFGYAFSAAGVEAGGTQSNLFSYNEAYDVNVNGMADAHCMWFGACSDFLVERNAVYRSTAFANSSVGSGVGIFVDINGFGADNDGCKNMIIRHNRVYATGAGATLNLEVGGAGIMVFLSQNVQVYGNYVESCSNGIVVIGWYGAGVKAASVDVFNNTVKSSRGANYYICKAANLVALKNNVSVGGTRGYYIENTGAYQVTNYTESNNVAYGASALNWAGGDEPTQASPTISARTPSGTNLTADPLLDPITLRPLSGSPLIGAGTYLGSLQDNNSTTYWNPPTIGAFEYIRPRTAASTRTMRS